VLTLVITTTLQPWAQRRARAEAFSIRTDLAALLVEEGRFVQGPDGLTVYVQQIEQSGLLKNLFIYLPGDSGEATTWDAAEARFERVDGLPVVTMLYGSTTRYSSNGVLTYGSFDRNVFDLSPYADQSEQIRYKPTDLYLTQLLNPSPAELRDVGSAGELAAEAHSRLSAPLYALVAMAMALTAILGGAYSRTGYSLRIAKAAAAFLVVRVAGYGIVAASAWNGWLNLVQYLLPLAAAAIALRLLFRALKPRRKRAWAPYERLKARFA
jgi:lipopolysaccharide export system permease protein